MSKTSRKKSSKTPIKLPIKTTVRTEAPAKKVPSAAGKTSPASSTAKSTRASATPLPKASRKIDEKTLKAGSGAKSAAPVLAEGAKAPAFKLPRDGGRSVSLADYAGGKLVIFFYPRADTPGCTQEAIDFTALTADFSAAKTAVLGVSADPLKAQEAFRDKRRLTMPLISDETHAMLAAYGAWGEKSMYGKVFEGVLRTTVLIGADGRIARIWRKVKVDGHAEAVLEAARQI